jgi:eukaryotic-like serine/threonine-protein kinase
MDSARWSRVEDVFDRALAVDAGDRDRWLDAECADDAELRREVASLLASTTGAGASIRRAVAAEASRVTSDARATTVGRRLGPYRLRALLGEGGMGAVYLADRDDAQFAKQVAVKVLPHALGSPQAIARFRDERQILAALEHRHIVRLLDGGSTDEGLPYLVMEHIEGVPITAYARDHAVSIRGRIELVRAVCAALHYAHQNLIIHRDIKPSNILVDAAGTPKLLDFGIAKLVAPVSSFEREAKTRTGAAMFTPEYASPEQARGEAVSTATDVYSVGAVLYELMTDRPPHRAAGSVLESIKLICEVDPERPSAAAPAARRRELAGDLDNIAMKALDKDPARRYASIEQLADDLGRYLDGLPVNARVATLGYRVRKFAGRNKAGVIAGSLVATALVAATVISIGQARRADDQARRADQAAAAAVAEKTRAVSEAERAQQEAERARIAETQVQAQLDLIKAEQDGRAAAETTVREKTTEVAMTREQLAAALAKAQGEARIAEAESARAREAEQRAELAAAAEKKTRLEAEQLYEAEKKRRVELEQRGKEITTTLR